MDYKVIEKNTEIFFKYVPKRNIKKDNKKIVKESPFGVLKNINFD